MTSKEIQIKNGLIYLIPLAVNSFFPFIVISVFTRILTKEDFGIWGLAQVYAIFANGLTNFGMLTAYERNFFQFRNDKLKSAHLLYSSLTFVLVNFCIIAGLTYYFRNSLALFVTGSMENGRILFFAFCGQFFYGILSYYLTFFKNSEQAFDYSKNVVLFSLMNLIFSLLFVAWLHIGVIGLIYAQLLSGVLVFLLMSIKFFKLLKPSFSMGLLRESILIAYPLTPRIFLGVINSQFDKYMIGLLASIGGVGIYSIGQKVASAVFSIMTAIQNVFSPQVYKKMFDNGEEGGRMVGQYLTPFAYVCVAPALLVALFSEEIFLVLTPAAFHDGIDIVIILSMFYAVMFFGKQPQLVFAKKTFMTSWLSFFSVGLNIAFNISFITKWGALGAAWATLFSGLISEIISFIISQHYYRIQWEYKKVGLIYAIFFSATVIAILMHHYPAPYEIKVSIKTIFLILYASLGVHLDIITKDNLRMVRNMVPLGSRSTT
ncbi:MAG: oligosaccharide flippase family protein [Desulfobacterales bacterium]|nr:oligosaccharide flippase family protein [Desulfobacterales bacterium]